MARYDVRARVAGVPAGVMSARINREFYGAGKGLTPKHRLSNGMNAILLICQH